EAGLPSRCAHPERCLLAQAFALVWLHEGFERAIRGRVGVERDGRQRPMAQVAAVITVVLEIGAVHVGCEQSHTFCRLYSGEPYKWQPTGIKRTTLRSDANTGHLHAFEAKEHDELASAFQFHGSLRLRPQLDGRAPIFVMLAFQAAGATVTVAA